ncbi:uncharacterized protein V1510DRAFT_421345 [Dipodascopsis tothii]|uniref:uncharacterized protein n=1 Tax=Dipodascopsis tothii TaxID=44089 RepID=UPI0034CDEEE2
MALGLAKAGQALYQYGGFVYKGITTPDPNKPLSEHVAVVASVLLIVIGVGTVAGFVTMKSVFEYLGGRLRADSAERRAQVLAVVGEAVEAEKQRVAAAKAAGQTAAPDTLAAPRAKIVGFFHPFCNAGGGGERVLWVAIEATLERYPEVVCAVYTGDCGVSQGEILDKVKTRFGIELDSTRVVVVHLRKRYLVAEYTWPRLTLLGQALGSVPLAYEAVGKLVPDVFVDSMGYPFTYPLVAYVLGIPVVAYVHYPVVSSDMLGTVSKIFQLPRYVYWQLFALLYAFVGTFADVVMTNSTWTANHIRSVWWMSRFMDWFMDRSPTLLPRVLYPPCECTELAAADIGAPREPSFLALAQFRPEKRHDVMIEQFARFYDAAGHDTKYRLVLIGTVRTEVDRERVRQLQKLAARLGVGDNVDFKIELPWADVVAELGRASVGLNVMWNEHFGMGVVEYMAAGLVPVVHNSGGPKLDIVTPVDGKPSGFVFTTPDDTAADASGLPTLAEAMQRAMALSPGEASQYRARARASAERFSKENFVKGWLERMRVVFILEQFKHVDRISRGAAY